MEMGWLWLKNSPSKTKSQPHFFGKKSSYFTSQSFFYSFWEAVFDIQVMKNKIVIGLLRSERSVFFSSAGLAMVFNTQPFFDEYYPGYDIGMWLFGDAIVGGSAGIVIGGLVSDQIVKKIGLHARAWVLAGTQVIYI